MSRGREKMKIEDLGPQKFKIFKKHLFLQEENIFPMSPLWTDLTDIKRFAKPARSTRSIGRPSALGVGLRAWRGERVLGVEAGEFGSGGRSGSG